MFIFPIFYLLTDKYLGFSYYFSSHFWLMDMVLKHTIPGSAQLKKRNFQNFSKTFFFFFTFSKPVNHNFKIPWFFQVFHDCGNPAQIGGVC